MLNLCEKVSEPCHLMVSQNTGRNAWHSTTVNDYSFSCVVDSGFVLQKNDLVAILVNV